MFQSTLSDLISILEAFRELLPTVEAAGRDIKQSLDSGNKILTAGNGGSAADALHLAEDLVGRFSKERPPWPAICLCADTTLLTCIGNDYGFDQIFSRQILGLGRKDDVFIGFSTSGNSSNIINALKSAKDNRVKTILVMGNKGGKAKGIADYEIIVPSTVSARIQEVHTFILHSWLYQLEINIK